MDGLSRVLFCLVGIVSLREKQINAFYLYSNNTELYINHIPMAFYVKHTSTAGMLIKTSLTYTENDFSEIYL